MNKNMVSTAAALALAWTLGAVTAHAQPAPPPLPGGWSQQPSSPAVPPPIPQPQTNAGQRGGEWRGNSQPGGGQFSNGNLEQLVRFETQDFGVPATTSLHAGPMHGRTPVSIPGGRLITTKDLAAMVQQQSPYLILDVLGSGELLPGALPAAQASQGGHFSDQVQQQFNQFLQQATRGNKQVPLVVYCQSVECWMSYNAALRAINLGYSNVLWYRGGIAAWKQAGFPTMPAGGAMPPNSGRSSYPVIPTMAVISEHSAKPTTVRLIEKYTEW